MAIKFEDIKPDAHKQDQKATQTEKVQLARGTEEPTEAGSELPFGKPLPKEKKSRKRKTGATPKSASVESGEPGPGGGV